MCSRGESLTHLINKMKLFNGMAAATAIGLTLMTIAPAESFWGNSKKQLILGVWTCKIVSGKHKEIPQVGTVSFDRSGKTSTRMEQKAQINPDFFFQYRMRSNAKYRIHGDVIEIYDEVMEGTHLSSLTSGSHEENKNFRKSLEESMGILAGTHDVQDHYLEIAAISESHLILRPEGGGNSEYMCRK